MTEPTKEELSVYLLKEIIQTSTMKYIPDHKMVIQVSIWSEDELEMLKTKLKAKL